jgi:hypothetical protein
MATDQGGRKNLQNERCRENKKPARQQTDKQYTNLGKATPARKFGKTSNFEKKITQPQKKDKTVIAIMGP